MSASKWSAVEWNSSGQEQRIGKGPTIRQAMTNEELLTRLCLNCGRLMEERNCRLVCACGYHSSCGDVY